MSSEINKTVAEVDVEDLSSKHSGDLLDPEVNTTFQFIDVFRKGENRNLDTIATRKSVFDDEELCKLYKPPESYENFHRLDPLFRWTMREEIATLRKVDIKIFLVVV